MNRFLCLLLSLSMPLLADDEYDIQFSRLHKASGKLALTAKVVVDFVNTMSVENHVVHEDKIDVSATVGGDLEIITAGPKGNVTAVKFTVAEWKGTGDEAAAGLFKAGDIIELSRGADGESNGTVNGSEASERQRQVASAFLPLDSAGAVTQDDVFGPRKKVKVGNEWKIDAKASVREAEASGMKGLKEDGFKGSVRLEKVEDQESGKCTVIAAQVVYGGGGFALPKAPPTVKVNSMTVDSVIQTKLPVNPDAVSPWTKYSANMDLTAAGEVESPNGDVKVSLSVHRKESSELRLKAK